MKRVVFFLMFLSLGIMGAKAQKYHYDVNHDGGVNITDVIFVVNKILGNKNPDDLNKGEAVSLGLPSGTLWATYNVGTDKPEGFGDHYAFGETEVKNYFDWSNYTHCDGTEETCHRLGDISGTQYDVARKQWGGNWRIPTINEWQELVKYCTYEWTTYQGVVGAKLTSVFNNKSIFLPAAGASWEDDINDVGKDVRRLPCVPPGWTPDTPQNTPAPFSRRVCILERRPPHPASPPGTVPPWTVQN